MAIQFIDLRPLGPMLRPLLEQAADPMQQVQNGNSFARQFAAQSKPTAINSTPTSKPIVKIPSTVTIFKPNVCF